MSLKLCMCGGGGQGKQLARFKRASLMSGSHTDFILMRCAKCGRLDGYPRRNFQLAALMGTDCLWLTVQLVANYARSHAS